MDVVRLDDSYLPDGLVEGYRSMIWAERFFTNGDFEMVTPKIEATRSILPEGCFISHLETKEVMQVETHTIKLSKEGIPELNITGRTFDTFPENRVASGTYGEPWTTLKSYKQAEILALLLWTYLVEATGQDPSRVGGTHDLSDAIPGLVVTDSSTIADVPITWSLKDGSVDAQIRDILALASVGIRGIRPPKTGGDVVSFDVSGGGTRGDISRTTMPDISDMRLDVYNGLDRTRFQSAREPVIFHYEVGDIDAPSYLFSIKDFMTSAIVSSSIGTMEVWPETGLTPPGTIPTGLDRRVLYVDGGTKNDDTDSGVFTQAIVQKAMVELAKHTRKTLFDGAISPISKYKYGTHYTLGDEVSVIAQYGFEAEMLVAEHVRTQDAEGDRGFPTLILAN